MKLQPLTVHRPSSVVEAIEVWSTHREDAIFYAGGTELLLVMKFGFANYSHLIDLKRVGSLSEVSVHDEEAHLGAAATYQTIIRNSELSLRFPALVKMLSKIGNIRVRTTGTIGGNLAFADPHSDPLTFLIAANASVDIVGPDGRSRSIPIDQFTYGPYVTALEQGEILTTIRVPMPSAATRFLHTHVRFRERPALTLTATGVVTDGSLQNLALVVGAIEGVPRPIDVERALGEGPYDVAAIEDLVTGSVEPMEDLDGSPAYKGHLAGVFAGRLVEEMSNEHGERIAN